MSNQCSNCNETTMYHYTTEESAAAIEQSGTILQSNTGLGGSGVYGTTMDPDSNSTGSILWNNYDNNIPKESDPKNVECYVQMCVKNDEFSSVPAGGRDVQVHKGDINLSERDHKIVCKNK